MMKKLLMASVAATAAMMTQAGAADMRVKAPPMAAPIQYSDWSGFYVGIEGGYGWGRNRYDDSIAGLGSAFQGSDIARLLGTGAGVINNAFSGPSISGVDNNGFLGGGFFGAQKQYGSWVFGIEGDIDAASLRGSAVSTSASRETVVRGTFENPTVTLTGPGVDILFTKCRLALDNLSAVSVDQKCYTKDLNDFLKHYGITINTDKITVSGPLLPDGQTTLVRQLADAKVTRSVSVDTKIDLLSSVRGKVGFAAWDSVLLYGTGGLALAHGTNTITVTQQTTLLEARCSHRRASRVRPAARCLVGQRAPASTSSGPALSLFSAWNTCTTTSPRTPSPSATAAGLAATSMLTRASMRSRAASATCSRSTRPENLDPPRSDPRRVFASQSGGLPRMERSVAPKQGDWPGAVSRSFCSCCDHGSRGGRCARHSRRPKADEPNLSLLAKQIRDPEKILSI
jgi:hypothetical protein